MSLALSQPGTYHVAVRYSPYLAPRTACISETKDGLIRLHARRAGIVKLDFRVTASHALDALSDHTVRDLREEGIVETAPGLIRILNPTALAAIARAFVI